MNLKLTDLRYWIGNFVLLVAAYISMSKSNPYPFLAVAVPLILWDRAYVVSVLLFIAAIEGSFKTSADTSTRTETTAIVLVMPFFLYDLITHNAKKIPFKLSMLYILFGFFVFIGVFIWKMHPQIIQFLAPKLSGGAKGFAAVGVYIKMLIKILKIVFFFLYLKMLINKDKEFLFRAFNLMKDMVPYLTMLVLINMLLHGIVAEKFDTIHFGESHHGDFSANMNSLGVYLYIGIFASKSSWFKRAVSLAGLGCLLLVIMKLGSRNGILCFSILAGLSAILVLWNKNWGFKFTVSAAAIGLLAMVALLFKDSPTIDRFIYQTEEKGGGDRFAYWSAGLTSLKEDPLMGLGSDETSSIYAVGKYSPEVEDHVMHNTFIEFAVEFGIIGFVFYMVFVLTILFHALKNYLFALKHNEIILGAASISYLISIFAGLFISRIWESTLWYHMTLVFAIYIVWRKPVEDVLKYRKAFLIRGLADPLKRPELAVHANA